MPSSNNHITPTLLRGPDPENFHSSPHIKFCCPIPNCRSSGRQQSQPDGVQRHVRRRHPAAFRAMNRELDYSTVTIEEQDAATGLWASHPAQEYIDKIWFIDCVHGRTPTTLTEAEIDERSKRRRLVHMLFTMGSMTETLIEFMTEAGFTYQSVNEMLRRYNVQVISNSEDEHTKQSDHKANGTNGNESDNGDENNQHGNEMDMKEGEVEQTELGEEGEIQEDDNDGDEEEAPITLYVDPEEQGESTYMTSPATQTHHDAASARIHQERLHGPMTQEQRDAAVARVYEDRFDELLAGLPPRRLLAYSDSDAEMEE